MILTKRSFSISRTFLMKKLNLRYSMLKNFMGNEAQTEKHKINFKLTWLKDSQHLCKFAFEWKINHAEQKLTLDLVVIFFFFKASKFTYATTVTKLELWTILFKLIKENFLFSIDKIAIILSATRIWIP